MLNIFWRLLMKDCVPLLQARQKLRRKHKFMKKGGLPTIKDHTATNDAGCILISYSIRSMCCGTHR